MELQGLCSLLWFGGARGLHTWLLQGLRALTGCLPVPCCSLQAKCSCSKPGAGCPPHTATAAPHPLPVPACSQFNILLHTVLPLPFPSDAVLEDLCFTTFDHSVTLPLQQSTAAGLQCRPGTATRALLEVSEWGEEELCP